MTPASFEPVIDYVVVKIPRWAFEKFPDAQPDPRDADEVGGRGHGHRPHLQGGPAQGAARPRDRRRRASPAPTSIRPRIREKLITPDPDRIFYVKRALDLGLGARGDLPRDGDRPVVPRPDAADRGPRDGRSSLEAREAEGGRAARRELLREAKRMGFSDARLGQIAGRSEAEVRAARKAAGIVPVYKRVDTCAAEFESFTPVPLLDLRERVRGRPHGPQEGRHPRQRPQPHRAGHRVRLLLLPRRLRLQGGGVRDHHGQLQPRDGLHRLRHLRPALLRAAEPSRT